MNGVRDTEPGRLLGKTFSLIRLPHDEASRLFRPMPGDKKRCAPVDVAIPWTWTRSDDAKHALDCSPVIAPRLVVVPDKAFSSRPPPLTTYSHL